MPFVVVVPMKDIDKELANRTLWSILTGASSHTVHVHFQIKDSPENRRSFRTWFSQIRRLGRAARSLHFSIDFSRDSSASEALNRGYSLVRRAVASCGDFWFTWLGAGDVLLPGAMSAVGRVSRELPDIQWITGGRARIAFDGVFWIPEPTAAISNCDVARGHLNGKSRQFLQAEGTFFSSRAVGSSSVPFDPKWQLAFDFALWVRLAQTTKLLVLENPLGAFARHQGQLSEDTEQLNEEVMAVVADLVYDNSAPHPTTLFARLSGPRAELDFVEQRCACERQ